MPVIRIEHHDRCPTNSPQRSFGDVLYPGVNGQVDIGAGRRLNNLFFPFEPVLRVLLQYPFSRPSTKCVIQIKFHIGFPLDVWFIKIKVSDVRQFIDIPGGPHVTKEMGRHCVIHVFSNGPDVDLDAGQPKIFLREFGKRGKIKVFPVGEWN